MEKRFHVGDRIILIKSFDNANAGETGVILVEPKVGSEVYGVCFDRESDSFHTGVLGLYPMREYWVYEECLKKMTDFSGRKAKCKKCGKVFSVEVMRKSSNGDYYCGECSAIKNYSTKNNERVHCKTKKGKTYGFELECVKKCEEDYLNMLHFKYHLIPTEDGSLPEDGVEFKTPTYNSLRGLEKQFEKFDEWVDFSDRRCGQHINIGDTEYLNKGSIYIIRRYADEIFDKLGWYMKEHEDSTNRICGRFFTDYARFPFGYSEHSNWINLSHNERIEFRLSKFRSPRQYILLTKMWEEMTDCVINNFLKKCRTWDCEHNHTVADSTADKLVNIFKKYENLTK